MSNFSHWNSHQIVTYLTTSAKKLPTGFVESPGWITFKANALEREEREERGKRPRDVDDSDESRSLPWATSDLEKTCLPPVLASPARQARPASPPPAEATTATRKRVVASVEPVEIVSCFIQEARIEDGGHVKVVVVFWLLAERTYQICYEHRESPDGGESIAVWAVDPAGGGRSTVEMFDAMVEKYATLVKDASSEGSLLYPYSSRLCSLRVPRICWDHHRDPATLRVVRNLVSHLNRPGQPAAPKKFKLGRHQWPVSKVVYDSDQSDFFIDTVASRLGLV